TVTLIPNGIHHPPIEDGRLLPNSVKTSFGKVNIDVPRDREASFEPELIPNRKRDVSDIADCRQKLFQTRNSSLEQLFIYFVSNF
ncbi:transposase, partial [Enterococcus faecium]|uniref:transposase n=1 Tax=Enterococcus faecium TaxID=1352 RepID=UPI0021001214